MQLRAVEVVRVDLELVHALATATGVHARRPLVLVRVVTDVGEGWGECAALAAPTYTEEYADGAERVLIEVLVPMLLGERDYDGASGALATLESVRGQHMAKAALEMALFDVEGRATNRSLASMIGAEATSVLAGATVGIAGDLEALLGAVDTAVKAGYERIKCKIEPGWDLLPLAALRRAHPGVLLVADANGSYRLNRPEDRVALESLDQLGLFSLEQPLRAGDLVGHATLAAGLETPVLLDESVPDLDALDNALALGAADAISLKPARLGGIAAALEAVRRCRAAGVACGVGGLLESGIGRAAALAVAAMAGVELPGELGASDRYFAEDLTVAHVLHHGRLAVPSGPGLGVEVRRDVIAKRTRRAVVIEGRAGGR